PISLIMGQEWTASLDEFFSSPGQGLKQVGSAFGKQIIRDEDTVPQTFSSVIAANALRDPEDNIYDKLWYQQTAGIGMDFGADPLNLVGLGIISNAIRSP